MVREIREERGDEDVAAELNCALVRLWLGHSFIKAVSTLNDQAQQQALRPRGISFFHGHEAQWLRLVSSSTLDRALVKLGLNIPSSVLVLVGGAAGIEKQHEGLIQEAVALLANLAEELKLAIVDGGTDLGVMALMGEARAAGNYHFPLVGVAVEKLVHGPERPASAASVALEPNHTHFLFVPGQEWGDESLWLSEIASRLSQALPSLTILINGGEISRRDVNYSLLAKRPVLVLQGTGRLADELALAPPSSFITVVSANNPHSVASTIRMILTRR